jgi:hypothetical protein
MRWIFSARVLAAAALVAAAGPRCAAAPAQDAPAARPAQAQAAPAGAASRAERLRAARERWGRMSPEERKRIRDRFEAWSRLPAERQKELRRHLDDLGGSEGAEAMRNQIRRASPEQLRRMRVADAEIRRQWTLAVEGLPPRIAERLRTSPPEVQEWRGRQFAKACVALCRDALVGRYATPDERKAVEGSDRAAKRAALEALRRRMQDEVLAPRREELAALPEDERRALAARLVEEHAWHVLREARPDRVRRLQEIIEGREARPVREWFQRDFGVTEEGLGVPWAGKALMLAANPYRRDRAALLETLRPELRRIAGLPVAERGPALRALLERVR